ncbi:uncharacterized protein [Anoplolepis gracilipes]|uniref:uncharacterized protein n=1 Tax=Anoplolepis gracilipes TaxID=354296 RepID=UPI003B9DFFDD
MEKAAIINNRKEISNFKKSFIQSALLSSECNFVGKIKLQHMLLSTTYGLNSSYTKKIHVGLMASDGEELDFLLIVKLSSHSAERICFDMESWQKFQENMEQMSLYLNGDKIKQSTIIIDKIIINFTTAYGASCELARAVLVAYRENVQEDLPSENIEDTNANGPTPKKRKTYSVAIVMQRATFLGLENIVGCVNARLNQLNLISNSVNECARYLMNEIEINLPINSNINSSIIKLLINSNSKEIERNVRIQLKDLSFLDIYFEITFLEIISLYLNQIVHMIVTKRKL